ncbi:hypothetical protein [Streptomyces sp. NPDC048248]|uniref:hypothetical protein n=1 Tax=Streptomyces sp. NPDC048248 TaxID=3365523 RepID=UPI0037163755
MLHAPVVGNPAHDPRIGKPLTQFTGHRPQWLVIAVGRERRLRDPQHPPDVKPAEEPIVDGPLVRPYMKSAAYERDIRWLIDRRNQPSGAANKAPGSIMR